jgi:hypothetical protein
MKGMIGIRRLHWEVSAHRISPRFPTGMKR